MQHSDYFYKLDERTNERISLSLLLVLLAIPAIIVFDTIGIFSVSLPGLIQLATIGIFCMVTPRILLKTRVSVEFLKYYIISVVAVMISLLATQHHLGIYITYVLSIIVSLFYFDPIATGYACIMSYVLMVVALYFREVAAMAERPTDTVLHAWIAYGMGFTLEFLVVTPLFVSLVKIMQKHLLREERLLKELKDENERYSLALENSKDVLYEYDCEKDIFKYYGFFFKKDDRVKHSANYIENFSGKLNLGEIVRLEDVDKIKEFLERDCSGRVEVKLIGEDKEELWIAIEGYVKYQGNRQSIIVGRIKDINLEKIEEENRLLEGEGTDLLTGFYERAAGIRIIRRYRNEMFQGYHWFVFADFANAGKIRSRAGSIFCDAITSRIANVFSTELRSTDIAVRFSNDEFILYFQDRTPTMIEQTIERLKEQVASIYVGEGIAEFIDVEFKVYETIQDLENDALNTDLIKDIEVHEEYTDDVVMYAFNVLERTTDFNVSIDSLLTKIGKRYSLEYVRVLEESQIDDIQYCINEWFDPAGLEQSMYGEAMSVQRMKKTPSLYVCDNKELGLQGIYIVFSGNGLDGDFRDSICSKLQELAHIIAAYIMKFKYENEARAKTDFISSMSRDIRTPMSAIAGYAELMLLEKTSDTVSEYAHNIISSSNGMISAINDILDASKIEAGKFELVLVQYYLHDIIEDINTLVAIQIKEKDVVFNVRVDESVPDGLIGDNVRIRQIITNLVNNAIKFTDNGNIKLMVNWESGEDGGLLKISVKDTGVGIKEEDLSNVFSVDYGVEGGLDGSDNKNVGLALTKYIVDSMRGQISVNSEYGKGTEFIIEIPQTVFDSKTYNYENKETRKRAPFVIPFTTINARALVVDDNQVNLQVVKGLLSKYQIEVELVKSGKSALSILESDQKFDIVFMDHLMPEMDGIQCTELIRNSMDEWLQVMPIVALTANAMKGIEEDFAKAGMNGFLAKPVNLKELCVMLERFLPEEKRIYIQPEE